MLASAPALAPHEPPAYTLQNPTGQSGIILLCDHASNRIPACLSSLGLDAADQERHIAWDIGTLEVCKALGARLDAPMVWHNYSRLVVDCNRAPGHVQSIPLISDTTPIPGNQNLCDAQWAWRMNTFFWPYHHAIGTVIASHWRNQGIPPIIVSLHSFTPQLCGHPARPWQAGILHRDDTRLAERLLTALRARNQYVGDNEPYSGYIAGYSTDVCARASKLAHAVIEIRQDLIADETTQQAWATVLGDILLPLANDPSLRQLYDESSEADDLKINTLKR